MSISLGEISANVRADTSRFMSDLTAAQSMGNRFGGIVSSAASGIGKVFTKIGGVMSGVFTGLASRLVGFSSNFTGLGSLAGAAFGKIGGYVSNFTSKVGAIGGKIGKAFSNVGSIMSNVGRSIQNVGMNLTKYITLPLAGAGVAVFKFGKDFEKELSKVVGLVGVSREQVDAWGTDILELAPKLGKAPNELAEALFFVTSAGIQGAEAMDVLEMSGKASAAGLGETKTIADLVTSAMNAYGKANLSAADATDIVTMAVRQGKAEASELAGSMGQVLPLAAEMGVSFDQVAAAQAAMTRTGTPATEAATQLKSIMAGMLKPSKQASEQLEKMGTSAGQMRKKIKEEGLISALGDLRELTNKYGEEAMARVYPNIRGLMGVLDLMGSNSKENVEIFKEVAKSTGTLDDAFKSAAETTDFKWNQALSKLQTTAITFFDSLKSVMIPVLEKVTSVLDFVSEKFKSLPEGMQQGIVIFSAIAAIIGPALVAIGIVVTALSAIFGVLGTVIGAVASFIGGLSAPVLIVIGVMAGLIAIIVTIIAKYYSLNDIITGAIGIWNGFLGVLQTIGEFFAGVFGPVIQHIIESFQNFNLDFVIESFMALYNSLGPLIETLKMVGSIIGVVILVAIGLVIGIIDGLINAFAGVIGIITGLVGIVTSVFGILVGLFTGNTETIKESFISLWENVKAVFLGAFHTIGGFVTGFIDGLIAFFKGLYNTLVGHSIIPDMINGIIRWFAKLPGRVYSYLSSLVSQGVAKFNSFKSYVIAAVSTLISMAISRFNQMKSAVVSLISILVSSAVSRFKGIVSKFLSIVSNLKSKAVSSFNSLKSRIMSVLSGINLASAGKKIVQSLINGIKGMIGAAGSAMGEVAGKIRSYLPFSPAKEGPLKDLNNIDFYSSLASSLNKAQNKISIPAISLGNEIIDGISKSANLNDLAGNIGTNGNKNVNFNGAMNFYGVEDTYQFMQEMRSTMLRYSGRLI